MRVTQRMLNNNMLHSLSNNLSKMEKIQRQLATGKMISKPSDDPVGLSYSMRFRSELTANDQYQRNLDSAVSWVDYSETTIGQAAQVIQRARELAVQGANGPNPQDALNSIAAEIDQLQEQLREIANSRFNGKFVFNGQKTDQAPYPDQNSYLSSTFDSGKISFELSRGVVVDVNMHAGEIFGEAGEGDNIFNVLATLSNALRTGDANEIQAQLGNLDTRSDKVIERWTDLGAKRNRIDLIDNRLKDSNINLQALISKTEDADMAAVITNLKTEENVFQASLSAGARIIRPSLIDFLR
ncbi:flagellar hook-associated protein FlgL [Caldalkalibacillus mannanilyticus]|uniref:flagellar hook-associated protein FlgL n=1 Tax=Caldalkalibacillus mannanilyticus TaxID=1418 RepID=UPI00046A7DD9|nr:flagellar hook-associated protein FlgL [Caldalkalibacillus mannanilyticus]